jgi:hypothetical protein
MRFPLAFPKIVAIIIMTIAQGISICSINALYVSFFHNEYEKVIVAMIQKPLYKRFDSLPVSI